MIISSIHSFVFQGPKTKVPVRRAADQNPLSGEYITRTPKEYNDKLSV